MVKVLQQAVIEAETHDDWNTIIDSIENICLIGISVAAEFVASGENKKGKANFVKTLLAKMEIPVFVYDECTLVTLDFLNRSVGVYIAQSDQPEGFVLNDYIEKNHDAIVQELNSYIDDVVYS